MAKKYIITDAQIKAIVNMTNDMSAMIGCGNNDFIWVHNVKMIDRFLNNNGIKRKYK